MRKNKPLLILLFFSVILFPMMALAETAISVKQGGVVEIVVNPGEGATSVSGRFKGKVVPYHQVKKGVFVALLGIDMDQKISTLPFVSTWEIKGKTIEQTDQIQVQAAKFGLQKLTLPKKKVDLDPPTLKRVKQEKRLMMAAFGKSKDERIWQGPFIAPVEGKRQGTFGRRRLINGQPRRSHTGEDISAPTGTPILATNRGKVALVGHFFFNGRSIVIDHGLGLYSMYFHLSAINVKKGEMVETGALIGRVGASGRVTGPHLHWGMRLNHAKVDPYALVEMQLQ